MRTIIFELSGLTFFMLVNFSCSSQITKLVPLEEWIAYKHSTRNIKPLDKFIGKLRATYDFVFHKPENVSNIERILSKDKSVENNIERYKLILPTSSIIPDDNSKEKNKDDAEVFVELLKDVMTLPTTRESSISRISKGNSLDDIEPLEKFDDEIQIKDKKIVNVGEENTSFQLPGAFINFINYVLGFSQGLYLKLTNSTLSNLNNSNNNSIQDDGMKINSTN